MYKAWFSQVRFSNTYQIHHNAFSCDICSKINFKSIFNLIIWHPVIYHLLDKMNCKGIFNLNMKKFVPLWKMWLSIWSQKKLAMAYSIWTLNHSVFMWWMWQMFLSIGVKKHMNLHNKHEITQLDGKMKIWISLTVLLWMLSIISSIISTILLVAITDNIFCLVFSFQLSRIEKGRWDKSGQTLYLR